MIPSHASAEPAIELLRVSHRRLDADGKCLATLRKVTMSVARGEFVAVVGPVGCGKSTILNLITGLATPSAGEVRAFGRPVQASDARVGCVFQTDTLFPWRTVIDNVVAGPLFRGVAKAEAYESARHWLARMNLVGEEGRFPHQLSGEMRRRVALAQTFINGPQVLLLDDPFSALDAQTRARMRDELLRLWQHSKASVVLVTQDLDEAVALADKVYVLTAGPATVKAVHPIDIPRPRVASEMRYEQRFIELSRAVWGDLREETLRAAPRSAPGATAPWTPITA